MPSKKAFVISFGLVRVTMSVNIVPMTIAAGTPILSAGTIFAEPRSSMTIGRAGMMA